MRAKCVWLAVLLTALVQEAKAAEVSRTVSADLMNRSSACVCVKAASDGPLRNGMMKCARPGATAQSFIQGPNAAFGHISLKAYPSPCEARRPGIESIVPLDFPPAAVDVKKIVTVAIEVEDAGNGIKATYVYYKGADAKR